MRTAVKSTLKKNQSIKSGKRAVFSYAITKSLSTITLHQQETTFSLSMEVEKLEASLRIKRFHLDATDLIANTSLSLHDAAMIEIVLRALEILFAYACQQNALEIFFILPEEEAEHLTALDGFFGKCSLLMTRTGKKTSFSLYTSLEAKAFFFKKSKSIKTQIQHELWKAQRYDLFVKNYLQSHIRGEVLFFAIEKSEDLPSDPDNILSFPAFDNK